jgi:hypothetical protein
MTDEAEAAEAALVLNFIFMMKNGPQRPDKVPKTSHCLAMLNFLREDAIKVISHLRILTARGTAAFVQACRLTVRPLTRSVFEIATALIGKSKILFF